MIALQFSGHSEPFFAPIAVVVALSSPLGERGSNAIRLLTGVLVGIAAGELTVLAFGSGYGRLPVAMFAAMAFARVVGGPRLVTVQAAGAAILTVAAADGQAGLDRLVDAIIGAAVALVFSQILLSPEPVALVRRAAAEALARLTEALRSTAEALERRDEGLATDSIRLLRDQRDSLVELARLRKASGRVARHSAIWRSRIEPVVRETENVGHLDLLAASCLQLARAIAAGPIATADAGACTGFAASTRRLADAVEAMAADLGDRDIRQLAADHALDVARRLSDADVAVEPDLAAVARALRLVTTDVMVVAGVPPDVAAAAVRRGGGDFRVPAPPGTPRLPFVSERRSRRRE